jgi:2'-5' RNA ligase
MRTFIAIDLPEEIKAALSEIQKQLKSTAADVKWVAPENIHLTLKFLGERDNKKVEAITQILETAAAETKSYRINITSLGAFPTQTSPRVIWVGIQQGDAETKKIADILEKMICEVGIPKEDRPFSSHITIGRTRSSLGREKLVQELNHLDGTLAGKNLSFTVEKITLYKSTLTPKGPIYEALKEASLKAS